LQQKLTEAIRHIDHHVVAARDLIAAPRSIRLHGGKGAIEGRVGVGFGAYVGLSRDPSRAPVSLIGDVKVPIGWGTHNASTQARSASFTPNAAAGRGAR
jgi:hypothetical protein